MLYIIGIIELPDGTALFILYYLCYYIYYGYNIFILKKQHSVRTTLLDQMLLNPG